MMPLSIPVDAILESWFGDAAAHPENLPAVSQRWYSGGPAFDAELRERFGAALELAASDADWNGDDIRERLARVLLLDQFSRNIHRGRAQAFATDPLALRLSLTVIDNGRDAALTPIERSFFGMPLQHAEDRQIQQRSVAYFRLLKSLARHPQEKSNLSDNLAYAIEHAAIIERFGRYPHRNDVLGRDTTSAERDYLNQGAPRFGQ